MTRRSAARVPCCKGILNHANNLVAVLAYAIAAGCATVDAANAALPAYVLTLQFFVGLLIRIADIPSESFV